MAFYTYNKIIRTLYMRFNKGKLAIKLNFAKINNKATC
jgi:hypothetical protein